MLVLVLGFCLTQPTIAGQEGDGSNPELFATAAGGGDEAGGEGAGGGGGCGGKAGQGAAGGQPEEAPAGGGEGD